MALTLCALCTWQVNYAYYNIILFAVFGFDVRIIFYLSGEYIFLVCQECGRVRQIK